MTPSPQDPEEAGEARDLKRENRKLKRELRDLTQKVALAIKAVDSEMQKPSSFERGRIISKIMNALELQKDSARHFGLGEKL